MGEALVVKSKIKAYAKKKKVRISGDAFKAIDKAIISMIDQAIARAKANRRTTIKPADL